jgi:polyisoprenyl-phosphate glycosyltransferase
MAREKILVIGASGFVGAHLYNQLKRIGHLVVGTTTKQGFWRQEYLDGKLYVLDLTRAEDVAHFLLKERPSIIVNLAAYGNHELHENEEKIFQVNIQGLHTLFRYVEKFPETKLINIGSFLEYGGNVRGATEDSLPLPNSLFGVTKFQASQMISYYGKKKKFDCVHLRLFSVYGALEDPTKFIPKLVHMAKFKKLPILNSAQAAGDFIHIDDVLNCILSCLEIKHQGEIYNVCTGKKTSHLEIFQMMKEIAEIGENITFSKEDSSSADSVDFWGLKDKAINSLNFVAQIDLRAGLTSLLLGHQERNKQLFRKELQTISIIVYCKDDERSLPLFYERTLKVFKALEFQYEFVFVNDGSKDKSFEIIRDLSTKDPFVLGINHLRSFGIQASYLSGLKEIRGDAFLFMQANLQDPPELIPQLLKKWEKGFRIIGARRVGRVENLVLEKLRIIFYKFLKSVAQEPIHLDVGEFALMDRSVGDKLRAMEDSSPLIPVMRAYLGESYESVDYIKPEVSSGHRRKNFFDNFWSPLNGLFSIESKIPYAIFVASFVAFGLGLLLWSLPIDRLFIVLILLFVGLLQFQMIYLLRSTRKRPLYLVRSKIIKGKEIFSS